MNGLAVGDFGSGTVLISNLHRISAGTDDTELWRGTGNEFSGVKGDRIYQNTSWRVTAMTAADFDGGGDFELLTAFARTSGLRRIYKGGEWGIGSAIEEDTGDISAMAAGYPKAPSFLDRIHVATKGFDGNPNTTIWEGSGVTDVFAMQYVTTPDAVTAMAIGTVAGDTSRASFTAIENSSGVKLYRGRKDVLLQTWLDTVIYSSSFWSIPALAVRKRTDGNCLVTVFDHPNETQIREGNGLTGAVGDLLHKFSRPAE